MKIGIDISPLQTGHSVRGVGFYVKNLTEYLLKYDVVNQYLFLKNLNDLDKVDVLHIPYFDPFFIHLPLIKRAKLVVTVHDLTPLIFPNLFPIGIKGSIKWSINKALLKRADAIITDSDASKRDIHKLTGVALDKIHRVYLAASHDFKTLNISRRESERILKKYKLPEEFLLYVGDVTANKNLPTLIDAVKKTDITLVLVGKALSNTDYDHANPWNKDLVQIHKKISNNSQFKVLGFVDQEDLTSLYNLATASILPSLYEGFGLPVLEAMQSGCPVITTKRGSLKEVAGNAAYFVDPESSEDIAKGITEVMKNKKLQIELKEKGLEHTKKFSWKKTSEQTIQVYKSL